MIIVPERRVIKPGDLVVLDQVNASKPGLRRIWASIDEMPPVVGEKVIDYLLLRKVYLALAVSESKAACLVLWDTGFGWTQLYSLRVT